MKIGLLFCIVEAVRLKIRPDVTRYPWQFESSVKTICHHESSLRHGIVGRGCTVGRGRGVGVTRRPGGGVGGVTH